MLEVCGIGVVYVILTSARLRLPARAKTTNRAETEVRPVILIVEVCLGDYWFVGQMRVAFIGLKMKHV